MPVSSSLRCMCKFSISKYLVQGHGHWKILHKSTVNGALELMKKRVQGRVQLKKKHSSEQQKIAANPPRQGTSFRVRQTSSSNSQLHLLFYFFGALANSSAKWGWYIQPNSWIRCFLYVSVSLTSVIHTPLIISYWAAPQNFHWGLKLVLHVCSP